MINLPSRFSIWISREGIILRNKVKNFPNQVGNKFEGEPRAKAEYASKRADGTTNTHPQERMRASNKRESDSSELLE